MGSGYRYMGRFLQQQFGLPACSKVLVQLGPHGDTGLLKHTQEGGAKVLFPRSDVRKNINGVGWGLGTSTREVRKKLGEDRYDSSLMAVDVLLLVDDDLEPVTFPVEIGPLQVDDLAR